MSDSAEPDPPREDSALAEILADILARRRAGESPAASEYISKHPELREEIIDGLETMDLLDRAEWAGPEDPAGGPDIARCEAVAAQGPALGRMIAEYPAIVQRVIFLRNFEKRRWSEIAGIMGQSERELRRTYVRTIRDLIRRTTAPA